AVGEDYEIEEIPAELADHAAHARETMIEQLADADDELAELYLEGADISVEQMQAAIRRATVGAKLVPVMCGTAFKNKGVQPILDGIIDYLRSPLDVGSISGHNPKDASVEDYRQASEDSPFSALAFKIAADPYLGKLTYIRVYSGRL